MRNPFTKRLSVLAALLATAITSSGGVHAQTASASPTPVPTDAELVKQLPGFENAFAHVNGIRLHYVIGGKPDSAPLVLLPGWPETWWEYHRMLPSLAKHYRVIVVDIRGMNASDKPSGGYDKKTMAKDVRELVRSLGYSSVYMTGHDIGSQVAYAYAANYPKATRKLVLMDVAPPDASLLKWPIIPAKPNTFGPRIDPNNPFPWWFAFHQVRGLNEKLLQGRIGLEQDWIFHYLLVQDAAITPQDHALYAAVYDSPDAIRAGDAWYQAFTQDIVDDDRYPKLKMPVLCLAGPGYGWLKGVMAKKAIHLRVVHIPQCGHFIPEEQPQIATQYLLEFFR